ncbi:MAG: hypothetical protein JWQ09_5678 [Segetibacter sp.]|nr:hypothetical protein [Segetibacter sp.]
MRILSVVLKVVIIIALCADLFLWLAAHASGHNIPSKTDWSFGLSSLLLIVLLVLIRIFLDRKK